ncbi:hypothetical protein E2C01_023334 [Portunus trituberculatus]|uniref:Uncharacterized protein n=1 Tax=Portunus trituberculatus TaxID=210409 RepID=A0A5B7E9I7_PORTR|nr:hypothetical protein [Portunus trituberculatus]
MPARPCPLATSAILAHPWRRHPRRPGWRTPCHLAALCLPVSGQPNSLSCRHCQSITQGSPAIPHFWSRHAFLTPFNHLDFSRFAHLCLFLISTPCSFSLSLTTALFAFCVHTLTYAICPHQPMAICRTHRLASSYQLLHISVSPSMAYVLSCLTTALLFWCTPPDTLSSLPQRLKTRRNKVIGTSPLLVVFRSLYT